MLTLLLGIVAIVFSLIYFSIKPLNYWTNQDVKQDKPLRIFYRTWRSFFFRKPIAELVQYIYNQFPDVRYSGIYPFFAPTLVIKDAELIKQITVKDFEHFTDHRSIIPENIDPLWAKNLFALKGKKWRDMRSILSPSFTSSKMRAMFVLIEECGHTFVQYFLKKDQNLVEIEMKDVFTRFTNDVIATTAFGIKVDSLEDPNNDFYKMGKTTTELLTFPKFMKFMILMASPKLSKLLNLSLFDKGVSTFFRELIDNSIRTREEKGIIRYDMIHLLKETQKGVHTHEENVIDAGFATAHESDLIKSKPQPSEITNEDITAQALVFFFAGFDSVSSFMCFVAYELAINPDIQKKLKREVEVTLTECKGKLSYEALVKMKYMDMVISETLRKWPNALIADRVCTKPYTIEPVTPNEKPIHLKEGDNIWLPIFGIHRDPNYYPDPERFDPERFNDENKVNINPYTYLPFGLGPRNCIGSRFALLETKLIFFHILSNFELVPVEKTQIPLKTSTKSLNLTAEGGFWLGMKRNNN